MLEIDYCAINPCKDKNASCFNTNSRRECYCNRGFERGYNNKCFGKTYVNI